MNYSFPLLAVLSMFTFFSPLAMTREVEPSLETNMAESLQQDLNRQINMELESAYIYLGLASYFSSRSLDGFAHWMRMQAKEEQGHARRIIDFLIDREVPVQLMDVRIGRYQVNSALEAFEVGLQHEKAVTASINQIYSLAASDDIQDREVQVFLNWFVNEQVEEEALFQQVIDKLRLIGDNESALLILDHELGKREE